MNVSSPYLGVLVNTSVYRDMAEGRANMEKAAFYEEAAAKSGMQACIVRLPDLSPSVPFVTALVRYGQEYQQERVPFPQVIYNRAVFISDESRSALERIQSGGTPVFHFNSFDDKWILHKLLSREPVIRAYLPVTERATRPILEKMRKVYPSLLLQPAAGSTGSGTMLLRLLGSGSWELMVPGNGSSRPSTRQRFRTVWPKELLSRIKSRAYLVREWLPLVRVEGSPAVLRISANRSESGDWEWSELRGITGRKGADWTSAVRDARTFPLAELFEGNPRLKPSRVEADIRSAAPHIADYLAGVIPGLEEAVMDFGVTEFGKIKLLEVRRKDQLDKSP